MEIKDFKNRYSGGIGFAIGAGPSLYDLDVDLIKEHVCITVNSGIVKYPECDAFVSDDLDIKSWSYYRDIVKKSSCIKFLYKDKFQNECNDLKNVVLYPKRWWFSPEDKSYNYEGLKLTKNGPMIGGINSMSSAINILFLMGCNPIVLLGNDCKLSTNHKRYFFQDWPIEKQPFRISGYKFDSRNQNRGFNKKSLTKYWNKFAEVNRKIIGKEVEIIDCSDSDLRCFPKMHLQEIIDKYGSGK